MKRDRIDFKSINEKLTPGDKAVDELFKKADKMKAGEKYIGSAEEVFLSRGIIPEGEKPEELPAARVRDSRLAIAAAAAVLALAVGAAAIFGAVSKAQIDTASSQRTEENKTANSYSWAKAASEHKNDTAPWINISQLIDRAYSEYVEAGSDYTKLPELESFQKLVGYGDRLKACAADMVQNGELESGGRYFIAHNAIEAFELIESDVYFYDAENGWDYYDIIYKQSIRNDSEIAERLSLNDPNADRSFERLAKLIKSIDKQGDHKGSEEFEELKDRIGAVNGNTYFWYDNISKLYFLGLIDREDLDIVFEAQKAVAEDIDWENGLISADTYVLTDYWEVLTNDPKQYFFNDSDVESWVKLKLDRIAYAFANDSTLQAEPEKLYENVNYLSLKNLGMSTTGRAILSLYEKGELTDEELAYAGYFLPTTGSPEAVSGDEDITERLEAAAEACVNADVCSGMCGGNYRESGDFIYNRDAADKLLAAIVYLKDCENEVIANADEYKEGAYGYLDIYDFTSENKLGNGPLENRLTVILPEKKGDIVIVNDILYTGVSGDTIAMIADAIETAVPPYGKRGERAQYIAVTDRLSGADTAELAADLSAYARLIKDNCPGTMLSMSDMSFKNGESVQISFELTEESKESEYALHQLDIPFGEELIWIDGYAYYPEGEVYERLITYLENTGYFELTKAESEVDSE